MEKANVHFQIQLNTLFIKVFLLDANPGTALFHCQMPVLFHTVFADATVAYEKGGENVKKQQFNWACSNTEFQSDDVHQ